VNNYADLSYERVHLFVAGKIKFKFAIIIHQSGKKIIEYGSKTTTERTHRENR
jgi:hypothetical protein